MKHALYRPLAVLVPLLGASSLPAQEQEPRGEKFEARSFLPQDYQAEFFVDLEAMRECEFLDGLERSMPLKMLTSLMRNQTGVDVSDLHRVSITSRDRGVGKVHEVGLERVTIIEGSHDLGLPEPIASRPLSEFAGLPVLREQGFAIDMMWVSPKPGLLVIGSTTAIESSLQGKRRGGVPHPDLMAITAVRKPLLHFAAARCGMEYKQWVSLMGFSEDWVTASDPIDTAILRLELIEGEMVVVAELRFAKGESGPQLFASGLREALAMLEAEPALGAAAKVLEKVVLAQPDGGLTLTLELGSPREAGNRVAQMLTPMAFLVGTAEAAPAVIEVEVEAEAEVVPPPDPSKGEKSGKGKNKKK